MKSDEKIKGAEKAIEDAAHNQIKSSYLVTCSKIKALDYFATHFLLKLYCENNRACLTCSGCKKILSDNMTDVFKIHPENGMIKVDMIRKLSNFLYNKPFESTFKTIVIYEGDKMNQAAQNALLKPLEQPPKNTCFLILTSSDFGILPTVISRCENIRLLPKSSESVINSLIREGVSEKKAALLLSLSSGYLEEAKALYIDDDYFELREKTITYLDKLFSQKNYAVSYFVDFFESNKDKYQDILDIIKRLMMDIITFKLTNREDLIINLDQTNEIKAKSTTFTIGALYNMMEKLLEFEEKMQFNINFKLTCESMFFEVLKEKYKWLKS